MAKIAKLVASEKKRAAKVDKTLASVGKTVRATDYTTKRAEKLSAAAKASGTAEAHEKAAVAHETAASAGGYRWKPRIGEEELDGDKPDGGRSDRHYQAAYEHRAAAAEIEGTIEAHAKAISAAAEIDGGVSTYPHERAIAQRLSEKADASGTREDHKAAKLAHLGAMSSAAAEGMKKEVGEHDAAEQRHANAMFNSDQPRDEQGRFAPA